MQEILDMVKYVAVFYLLEQMVFHKFFRAKDEIPSAPEDKRLPHTSPYPVSPASLSPLSACHGCRQCNGQKKQHHNREHRLKQIFYCITHPCLVPLVKLAVIMGVYYLLAAVLQPVSDERITGCLAGMGNAVKYLFQAVFTVMVLFLLTIALTTAMTSR